MNFERGKDPKEALGIGVFQVRHFKDDHEACDFIISNLNAIISNEKVEYVKYRRERMDKYIMDYVIVGDGFGLVGMADQSLVYLIDTTLASRGIKIKK